MVGGLSIAAMFFTMLVPFAVLIAALIYFLRKYKFGVKPLLVGAGVFIVFALVLEGLLNHFILVWNGPTAAFFKNPIAFAIYGALAAGVFEETGRLAGFKLFFKKSHEWKHGIAYGLGHGGIELLIFGGLLSLSQISNVSLSFMINNGTFSKLQKTVANMPAQSAALDKAREQLISLPSWEFFLGGLERIDAFFIQLALSILVLYAVAHSRYFFYIIAIIMHAAVDFSSALYQAHSIPIQFTEIITTIFAIIAAAFVILSRKLYKSGSNKKLEAV